MSATATRARTERERRPNPESLFDQRIDLVLIRGAAHVRNVDLVGEEEADRTASGLWPSDHAGVVATVDFRP
jgi:endonuclease/exonuclease/phosphatase family metal-dependent hydrolase